MPLEKRVMDIAVSILPDPPRKRFKKCGKMVIRESWLRKIKVAAVTRPRITKLILP